MNIIETEMALLGAVLINPGLLDTLPLLPEQFKDNRHALIYAAMQQMNTERQGIDLVTLSTELSQAHMLDHIGGMAYLGQLAAASGSSIYAETYAGQIIKASNKRQLLTALNDIAGRLTSDDDDPDDIAAEGIERLSKIGSSNKLGAQPIALHHHQVKTTLKDRRDNPDNVFSLASGFTDLDRTFGLAFPDDGTLIMIVADAGLGKTILGYNIATAWARQEPGAIYSMEMSAERLLTRDYNSLTEQSAALLKRGLGNLDKLDDLDGYYERLPMFLSTRSDWTTASLRADLMRLKYEAGIKWFMLDYMSLLKDTYPGEEPQRQGILSKRLMSITRSLNMAAIIIHTPNKSGELAGVQGVKHDVDIAFELRHRTELRTPTYRVVEIRSLKSRDQEGGYNEDTILGLRHDRPQFISITRSPGG